MRIMAVLALAAMALVSASCATNPVATASTVDQKTYAIYGEFVVFEEIGAQLVQASTTPAAAVSAIKAADKVAKPVMDSLLAAELLTSQIRVQLAAGTTTQDKLDTAMTQLSSWVSQATPLVNNLVTAVKGAGT